jgi:copper chaperone CopZ
MFLFAAASAAAALRSTPARAEQPEFIALHVDDIHCSNCAKRLAAHLYTVPGVVQVKINVKSNLAFVVPQEQKDPSLKALWEAAQAAKMTPTKLVSRAGTFTSKPTF